MSSNKTSSNTTSSNTKSSNTTSSNTTSSNTTSSNKRSSISTRSNPGFLPVCFSPKTLHSKVAHNQPCCPNRPETEILYHQKPLDAGLGIQTGEKKWGRCKKDQLRSTTAKTKEPGRVRSDYKRTHLSSPEEKLWQKRSLKVIKQGSCSPYMK